MNAREKCGGLELEVTTAGGGLADVFTCTVRRGKVMLQTGLKW